MTAAGRPTARSSGGALDLEGMLPVGDYPGHFAQSKADATAILFDGRRWSYAQLERASSSFAGLLRDRGIAAGDRIAYHGRNNDLYFAVLFGAMRAGVVLVPINWRNTASETRFILADSDAKLVLTDTEFADLVAAASGDLPMIAVDAHGPEGLRALLESASVPIARGGDQDAPVLQLYTSGTTGTPKGVLTTQRMLNAQRQAEFASGHFDDWTEGEVLFSPLPSFHIGGISWALTAMARGLPVIVTADPAPARILDIIVQHQVTRAFMVPTLVRALIDEMAARSIAESSLRGIHYGAAAMDPPLLEHAIGTLGCRFLQYYGMTEAGGSVTVLGPACHDLARPHLLRSVGRPLPGFAIEIRDANAQVLPVDTAGEIWISGPSLMQEYWHRPEATTEALRDGWYRSGDGGRIDADGFLYMTDRIKDMIVSGGENVYPAEVEAVLRTHPAVSDCAVFGLPHPKWGEGVAAAVETKPGSVVSADELIAFARAHLAAFKIPRRIEIGVTLPRTASGKVRRGAIRLQYISA